MLKITYLENEIYLEYLQKSIDAWKADRMLVNLRAAASIYMESSIASLVLPVSHTSLRGLLELAEKELIEIAPCDEEFIEVSLIGTWIAENKDSESGIFACELDRESEDYIWDLWQESQIGTSVVSEN